MTIVDYEPETVAVIRTPGATWGNLIVTSVSGRAQCGDVTDGIVVRVSRVRTPVDHGSFVISLADLREVIRLAEAQAAASGGAP